MIKAIISLVDNMKVRSQLLAIYITVILIPIFIIGIYITRMLCQMVVERSIDEAKVNIERIEERLDEKIKIACSVAESLYVDEKIKNILSTQYTSAAQVVNAYEESTEIATYLIHFKELSSIRIYTKNSTLLNNSQFIQVTSEIEEAKWYQEALSRGSRMEWVYKYDEYRNLYNIALVRTLKSNRGEVLGVLVITLDTAKLRDIIKDEPYATSIIFNEVMIVSTGKLELFEEGLRRIRTQNVEQGGSEKFKVQSQDGEGYIIFTHYRPLKTTLTDIEICVYMSVNAITEETRRIIARSFSIMVVSAFVATLLIHGFIKRFSQRIILVKKEMARVVEGDFNIQKCISGKDEIGELYGDIYQTVQSVQVLVKEIYEAKVQKEELKRRQKEMEFEMLAHQINPHFLYNTLETIRMKALCGGDGELAHIVKVLSKLLRRNIEVSESSVTIASEIAMIKAYLEIQRYRFGERIAYEIECDLDAQAYEILPLILQPIIENAFIHGLEGKLGPGKIRCGVFEKDAKLNILVEDDGLGMDKARLNLLISHLEKEEDKTERVGLRNIHERIKLYYGVGYGITIESTVNVGTRVTVILPLVKGGEE